MLYSVAMVAPGTNGVVCDAVPVVNDCVTIDVLTTDKLIEYEAKA